MEMAEQRCQPVAGQPTTYRGLHDMACWWEWSIEVERHSVGTYRELIRPGDLCFDIGANRGRKTWIMRLLGAKVVAVDPLLAFGDEFVPEFWWKWGSDKDVQAVGRAVANGSREIEVSINKFMPYVSSIDRAWMTVSAHGAKDQPYYRKSSIVKRKVATITLDGLVNIYGLPRFIKIDVEGAENRIVPTLTTPVYALNMEFHQDWMPGPAMAHMDTLAPYLWTYALGEAGRFEAEWMPREQLLAYMANRLTKSGAGSWGDIYGRMV